MELSNQSPAVHTTIGMKKVSNGLFCIIFYISPSQYRETYEVLRDYPKIEGINVKDYAKFSIRNLFHANSCVHSRRLIAALTEDGIKYMENCNHIVQIWILQMKVDMIELSSRLHIIDGWFPSFMCNLLESSIIPNFICKSHICTMWLQFFHTFYSIFWKLSNQYPAVHITIGMQKVSNGMFCTILNISPPIFG